MTPAELVERLDAIGWFEGLPAEERARVLGAATSRPLDDPHEVAAAMANVVVALDGVCEPNAYEELLRAIAEAVPFAFQPDVVEVRAGEDDEDEIRIRIGFGDRSYRCVLDQEGDWADAAVFDFIDGILEDRRGGFRLFELPVNDPEAHLAICRPAAFERAVAAGLLPAARSGADDPT